MANRLDLDQYPQSSSESSYRSRHGRSQVVGVEDPPPQRPDREPSTPLWKKLFLTKSGLKVLLALAIPIGIGYVFWSATNEADRQIATFNQTEKGHKTTDHVIINNYELKEVDDSNRVRWQLLAGKGEILPNNQDVMLEDVKIEYYDPATRQQKLKLVAQKGMANQSSKWVKLSSGDQPVTAEGDGGKSKFVCGALELTKNDGFIATYGVTIEWPGVAKVTGERAEGSMNLGAAPKNLKVFGNTHALIGVN